MEGAITMFEVGGNVIGGVVDLLMRLRKLTNNVHQQIAEEHQKNKG